MSSLIVKVVKIDAISDAPNTDRLEIATVGEWTCCVKKGQYAANEKAIYIPVDAVLPEELSNKLGVTQYLSKGRVRATKLRGIISMGLLIGVGDVEISHDTPIGTDVADILGIKKFEPPQSFNKNSDSCPDHHDFLTYVRIENIKNFPDILRVNEPIVCLEKIHGTNFRAANIDGTFLVGSHRRNLKESSSNLYWQAFYKYNLAEKLKPGDTIYGEIYGKKVQKGLEYGALTPAAVFFDIQRKGTYLNWDDFFIYAQLEKLPIPPVIISEKYKPENLKLLSEGKTLMPGAKHIREGIVIRPKVERQSLEVGRVIFKSINPDYLLKDYGDAH